jgi:hypothetical protein
MHSRTSPLLIALATFVAAATPTGSPLDDRQQKPVTHNKIYIDGGRQISSLDDLWRLSSVVAEGTVVAVSPMPEFTASGTPAVPTSRIAVRLIRVFKTDERIRDHQESLELLMIGAERDKGDHVEASEDPNLPLLKKGQHPILFLTWRELSRDYELATGTADSVFTVDDGIVNSRGRSATARELAGLKHGNLASLLNAKGGTK